MLGLQAVSPSARDLAEGFMNARKVLYQPSNTVSSRFGLFYVVEHVMLQVATLKM